MPKPVDIAAVLPRYPIELRGTFEDANGRDDIVILNDGHLLTATVRGVTVSGTSFDMLDVDGPTDDLPFSVDKYGTLSAGTLTFDLQLPIVVAGELAEATLSARVDLPPPLDNVTLQLKVGDSVTHGSGIGGDFEAELESIVRALPDGIQLLSCYTCGLSDYSPYGKQLFGDLACFRRTPGEYRTVKSKWDMFALWRSMTEIVQETHLCGRWETRPRGRGYRG